LGWQNRIFDYWPIAPCARFRAQEVIFREGEIANRFYLLKTGKVTLESTQEIGGAPMVIDTIGPGDLLGWSWIFPPHIWHFAAPRRRADGGDLFLRHNSARVLR
jgi:hypothetical protein